MGVNKKPDRKKPIAGAEQFADEVEGDDTRLDCTGGGHGNPDTANEGGRHDRRKWRQRAGRDGFDDDYMSR